MRRPFSLHLAQDRIAALNGAAITAGTLGCTSEIRPTLVRRRVQASDIEAVIKAFPHLTHFGMGISRLAPGKDFATELKRGQQELVEAAGEVEFCCQFLEHVDKRRTIDTRGPSSYGLKHQVEVFQRAKLNRPDNAYVSNGAFICAAIIMGFENFHRRPPATLRQVAASVLG